MKRILVFSDGTGNSSAKAEKTNVWRLFRAVDQTMPDQLAKYDDGVGTSSNKYLAALGGVFGYGLKRNVIALYKFICRNHEDDDELYGFGFSRGAFTIRMLVGLVDSQGLVPFRSEEELHANAVLAYRRFRSTHFKSRSPIVWLGRHLRDLVLWPFTRAADAALKLARSNVKFQFLGLWDTVAAYGMPIDELKWGISLLIWPMVTADHKLSKNVERACHALSLDDQRQTFHPILFDESEEPVNGDTSVPKRITQVWFPGVHSNVGGGYPEDQLSLVSLDWVVSQMKGTGVRLDETVLADLAQDRSAYARIYDSRAGVASYYRYDPRSVDMGGDVSGQPIAPVVHGSVIMRMVYGSDAYAPISLPSAFNVLAPDGELLSMHGFSDADANRSRSLAKPATTVGDSAARTAALKDAIADLNPPNKPPVDAEMVRQVHDTVWWRRVTYFACLFSTLYVVAFPYAAGLYSKVAKAALASIPIIGTGLVHDVEEGARWFTPVWRGWTSDLFRLVAAVTPSYAKAWLDALANQPLEMLAALALVALFFGAGTFLAQRIHDRARFAWHRSRREIYLEWVVGSARSSLVKSMLLTALAAVCLLVALTRGATREVSGTIIVLTAVMLAVTAWRIAIVRRLRVDSALINAGDRSLPPTPTLKVARFMRSNASLVFIYRVLADRLVPLVFAAALVYAIVGVVYHAVLRATSSAGLFCAASPATDAAAIKVFETTQVCWASGLRVKKGSSYEVELTTGQNWRDRTLAADAAGVSSPTIVHALAEPMKRSWGGPWFQPILRVGARGDDEHPMTAVAPENRVAKVRFTAERNGELFLYVNDAILLVPGKIAHFYENNHGTGSLSVCELSGPPRAQVANKPCEIVGALEQSPSQPAR